MAADLVAAGLLRLQIELPFVDWGSRFNPDFRFKFPEFTLIKGLPGGKVSWTVGLPQTGPGGIAISLTNDHGGIEGADLLPGFVGGGKELPADSGVLSIHPDRSLHPRRL